MPLRTSHMPRGHRPIDRRWLQQPNKAIAPFSTGALHRHYSYVRFVPVPNPDGRIACFRQADQARDAAHLGVTMRTQADWSVGLPEIIDDSGHLTSAMGTR